eukprot:TRINITY_DN39849_c0_g1_i1.p1 TRINITY_DN39849_c0_g1~~TRINITY_DN39849_c0_g1_i1.p1  ORF type:complete len:390 (+),score=174.32 TRINITY_DN39849_c0_g1_i1:44-1171(+)
MAERRSSSVASSAAGRYSAAAVNELLGMPFSRRDMHMDGEDLVMYMADLLRSEVHREAARAFLAQRVQLSVDLSGSSAAADRPAEPGPAALPALPIGMPEEGEERREEREIVLEPAWRRDKYLRRLRSPKRRSQFRAEASNEIDLAQLSPLERLYATNCQVVVVKPGVRQSGVGEPERWPSADLVITNPKCNRSVLRKLAEIGMEAEEVDMSQHLLGNVGVVPLLVTLRAMPRLRYINISRNDIRVEAVQSLRDLAAYCPTLTSIDLHYNRFLCASAGRELLTMVKERHPQLKHLGLAGTSLPEHYIKSIARLTEAARAEDEVKTSAGGGSSGAVMPAPPPAEVMLQRVSLGDATLRTEDIVSVDGCGRSGSLQS